MGECWIKRLETVPVEGLTDDRDNGHENTNETVLEDEEPNNLDILAKILRLLPLVSYIEPCQSAPRYSPWPSLTAATLLEPTYGREPALRRCGSKIVFLTVKVGRDVMTEKGEEAGDGDGFVAVSNDGKVYFVGVKDV